MPLYRLIDEQVALQNKYKREMRQMAAVLKQASLQQHAVVQQGNAMIDDVDEHVGENKRRIQQENQRLEAHTNAWKSGTLFYWLVLIFVTIVFVGTVLFMKVTPA